MRMFHRFKGMLFCSLLCGIVLSLASGEAAKKKIEVFIEPVSVRTGETAYYVIRSNDGARNRPLSALPSVPGLRWMGGMSQSSRVSIVNGKRSSVYEVRIPFVAEKDILEFKGLFLAVVILSSVKSRDGIIVV